MGLFNKKKKAKKKARRRAEEAQKKIQKQVREATAFKRLKAGGPELRKITLRSKKPASVQAASQLQGNPENPANALIGDRTSLRNPSSIRNPLGGIPRRRGTGR